MALRKLTCNERKVGKSDRVSRAIRLPQVFPTDNRRALPPSPSSSPRRTSTSTSTTTSSFVRFPLTRALGPFQACPLLLLPTHAHAREGAQTVGEESKPSTGKGRQAVAVVVAVVVAGNGPESDVNIGPKRVHQELLAPPLSKALISHFPRKRRRAD